MCRWSILNKLYQSKHFQWTMAGMKVCMIHFMCANYITSETNVHSGEAFLMFLSINTSHLACLTNERESILPADKTLTKKAGTVWFNILFLCRFLLCSATAAPVYGRSFTPSVISVIHTIAAPIWLSICTSTSHTFDMMMFKHSSAERFVSFLTHVLSWSFSPHLIWLLIFSLPAHFVHFSSQKMAVDRPLNKRKKGNFQQLYINAEIELLNIFKTRLCLMCLLTTQTHRSYTDLMQNLYDVSCFLPGSKCHL